MSRISHVVCNCDELAKEMRSAPLAAGNRISSCYSPLETDSSDVKIRTIDTTRPIKLVYFGREGGQKRVADAINLVASVNRLGLAVQLSVYGYQGSPVGSDVDPNITFCGITSNPFDVMKRSDGILLVSEYESFPTVIVEAATCGTPIFCNDFRLGRHDFERLVGPINLIDPLKPESLVQALKNQRSGKYTFKSLSNVNVTSQWQTILSGLSGKLK
jgi:glycosyltransferase involved in cell wall biosynthesis